MPPALQRAWAKSCDFESSFLFHNLEGLSAKAFKVEECSMFPLFNGMRTRRINAFLLHGLLRFDASGEAGHHSHQFDGLDGFGNMDLKPGS
ncbi:hypothetical protein B1R32_11335 [Abditibacterium utsteinense]|uniref:Uncharacterized protein n=1 Tax=Abditibacterium utsteinense TaxID=1960156 RepID=A0A2S8SRA4_9BACT|nr:hypothetical protein B1R32_11335 [Abditibacterium utsteinense]